MKRRRIALILLGSVAAVTLAIFIWPREREPEYNGVKLSVWLERYKANLEPIVVTRDTHAALVEACSAIREIGTNSLPFVIRWIQYEQPAWRKSFYSGLAKLPDKILGARVSRTLLRRLQAREDDRADNSVYAFQVLRQQAQPAVPELRRLARIGPMHGTYYRATACLAMMGEHDAVLEIWAAERNH